jgi:hypothetical protein
VPAEACSTLAATGFTVVQNYAFESSHPPDATAFVDSARAYLDTAWRHGLRVLLGVPRNWLQERREDLLRQVIRGLRDHDAILAWYEDERAQSGDLGAVEMLSRIVAAEDPTHGLIIEEMLDSVALRRIGRARMFTYYPVTHEARQRERLKSITQRFPVHTLEVPFWPVLQVFGRDLIAGYPKTDFMAPSWNELQYTLYSSLIAGCRGIFFYTYRLSTRYDEQEKKRGKFPYFDPRPLPEVSPRLWKTALTGTSEARLLLGLLQDGTPTQGVEITHAMDDLEMRTWKVDGGTLVLIANPRYVSGPIVLRLGSSSGTYQRLHRGQFGPQQPYQDHQLQVVLPGPGGACLLLTDGPEDGIPSSGAMEAKD